VTRRSASARGLIPAAVVAAATLLGCPKEEPKKEEVRCAAGSERACFADDGCRGLARCRDDGSGFAACACVPSASMAPPTLPPPPKNDNSLAIQCQLLFDTIKTAQEPLADTKGTGAADMRKMAARLEIAAAEVRRLQLTDAVLVQAQLDYASMVEDLARGARDVADARDRDDPRRAAAAIERMSSFESRGKAFAALIDERCNDEPPPEPATSGQPVDR
jgi:hypothetical protein